MSTQSVLNDNWSAYDDRKKRGGSDHNDFACTEPWEVNYLVEKIRKHHPGITENSVRTAIDTCCRQVGAPHPRAKFVSCVMQKLGL